MREKSREMDLEIHFKDAFRAFSKDDEGPVSLYPSFTMYSIRLLITVSLHSTVFRQCPLTLYPSIPAHYSIFVSSGCIPADELKFVMNHLPGKVELLYVFIGVVIIHFSHDHFSHVVISIMMDQLASGEIEDMIETVDRNKDGKISYSEFRVINSILIKK